MDLEKLNKMAMSVIWLGAGALGTGVLSAMILGAQSNVPPAGEGQMAFVDSLVEIGEKFDCYFTFEEGWKDGEAANATSSYLIRRPVVNTNVRQVLAEIAKSVPHVRFEFQQTDHLLVHAIDTRLDAQKEYALSLVVRSIDLVGPPVQLVAELKKQGVPISLQSVFPIGRPLMVDRSTRLNVRASGMTVRKILSDFIPLKGYSRVLWIGTTKLMPGSETVVNFNGPKG